MLNIASADTVGSTVENPEWVRVKNIRHPFLVQRILKRKTKKRIKQTCFPLFTIVKNGLRNGEEKLSKNVPQ